MADLSTASDTPDEPNQDSVRPATRLARAQAWWELRGETVWFFLALFVVLAGFVSRLWGLSSESLWNDELATLRFTAQGPIHAISAAAADTGPPLYYIFQSLLNLVVPASEWSMRILSAVFGGLTVWVTYLIGSRMHSRALGTFAAALAVVSGSLLAFAQEARAYSLATLLAALVALSLLWVLDRPSPGRFVLHFAIVIAACYTHLFGLIAAAGIELAVLLSSRMRRRLGWKWAAGAAVAVIAYLPWMLVLYGQASRVAGNAAGGAWYLQRPESLFGGMMEALEEHVPSGDLTGPIWMIFAALLVFGALGAWALSRKTVPGPPQLPFTAPRSAECWDELAQRDCTLVLLGWVGMVFIGGVLVSMYVVPIFSWRMAIVAVPGLYLLAASGLRGLWTPAAYVVAAVLLVSAAWGIPGYYSEQTKERWRPLVGYLEQKGAFREGFVGSAPWMVDNVESYAEIVGYDGSVNGIRIAPWLPEDELLSRIEGATEGKTQRWFVIGHLVEDEEGNSPIDTALEEIGWTEVDAEDFGGGIEVRLYRPSEDATPAPPVEEPQP
ncbi:MAG: glycosyltransferase family 39 protein [Coriobacteriales bacterium]|nr:glycosyltransferase family 39 protein [Coriobacteriales bacterium]